MLFFPSHCYNVGKKKLLPGNFPRHLSHESLEITLHEMTRSSRSSPGFTLIELLIVVTIVGVVASIAPSLIRNRELAHARAVASNLKTFAKGFQTYQIVRGTYPTDWHLGGPYHLPPGMEEFIAAETWAEETQLGGNYNWEGPDNYPYAGISLYASTASEELVTLVDQMLDDGDLDQGVFRETPNGRYTYIIEE